jgi:hypothetical protein
MLSTLRLAAYRHMVTTSSNRHGGVKACYSLGNGLSSPEAWRSSERSNWASTSTRPCSRYAEWSGGMGRWSVPVMRSIASSIVHRAGAGGAIRPSPSLSKTDANKAAGRRRGTARTFRALAPGDCRARYLCTSWKRDLSCSTTAEASCATGFACPTNASSSEAEPVRERSASVTRDGIEIRSGGLRCEPDSVLAASDSSVEGSTMTSRFSLGLRRRMLGFPPDLLSRMLAVRAEASPRVREGDVLTNRHVPRAVGYRPARGGGKGADFFFLRK